MYSSNHNVTFFEQGLNIDQKGGSLTVLFTFTIMRGLLKTCFNLKQKQKKPIQKAFLNMILSQNRSI